MQEIYWGKCLQGKKGKNPEEAGRIIRQLCRYDPCEQGWERQREGKKVGLAGLDLGMLLENFNQASQESLYQSCCQKEPYFFQELAWLSDPVLLNH